MWKNRNVWIILVGEMIAGLGLWTGIIGNLEFMQEKIPSDFLKSVIMAIGLLAGILAGPLAGKIIDQSKKKTVLLISGFGRMMSVVFMLIAIQTGSIWWMVAFMISIQLSATFYFPALQATIPLVVKDDHLLQMNGWHMNVATMARVIGTALAGVALVYWSLQSLYIMSMIAYAGLLIFTYMLRIDEEEGTEAQVKVPTPGKGGFMEVFPILKSYPAVMMTLVMTLIPLLFIGSFNLIVINISELQDSSSIKGAIYAAEGIAFMLGTIVVKFIAKKWSTDLTKPVFSPERAMQLAAEKIVAGEKIAVLFGPERAGLENDDIARANAIVSVPVNPEFASLNLGQCVLLTAYEWQRQAVEITHEMVEMAGSDWATGIEIEKLAQHYEERLDTAGFFFPDHKAESMMINLRNLWSRMPLTRADVQMLHGVMRQMVRWKERG